MDRTKQAAGSQGLSTVAFDADDTLWHNQRFYHLSQEHFAGLLRDYAEPDSLMERLQEAELRNVGHNGYGIKGFTLSMIETAIEITHGRVPARVIGEILEASQEMMRHPVELLPHAMDTVSEVGQRFQTMLITKGDLLDQERKIADSGVAHLFDAIEIVSDKTPQAYQRCFERHTVRPEQAMMVGNSMKSDVIPALLVGSWGVFVPHDLVWSMEQADSPDDHPRFKTIAHLGELAALTQLLA